MLKLLPEQTLLISAFSDRVSGNMSLFYADTGASLNNRRDFLGSLGINYQDLVCAKQIHGSLIRYVNEEDKGKGALSYETAFVDTDAFVTDKRNLPLAVFTADCLSVFLYDPATPAIGLLHAGWRSSKEEITTKAVRLMQKEFNTKASNLFVGFGPAIRSCCYEVNKDFGDSFPYGLIKRNNLYYLDLVGINKQQLLGAGVKADNIFDPEICTSCRHDEFFSYRKGGKTCGRIISVIMLK